MLSNSQITKSVKIPPQYFHIHKQFITKKLNELEGKNYSNEIGFISKILDIVDIKVNAIIKDDFSGCIVYNVTFDIEHYNPSIGDTFECEIIQSNNVLLAINGPYKIIIIEEQQVNEEKLQDGDKVYIEVLCKEINVKSEYIKIVGRFLHKIE